MVSSMGSGGPRVGGRGFDTYRLVPLRWEEAAEPEERDAIVGGLCRDDGGRR